MKHKLSVLGAKYRDLTGHKIYLREIVMLNWKIKPEYRNIYERTGDNGTVYLSFPALEDIGFIRHAFSTRLGGVSKNNQSSMNLGFSKEPLSRENVMENFSRITSVLGAKPDDLVFTQQTHTVNVKRAMPDDRGKGIIKPLDYSDVDGLITDASGILLTAFFADCIPLYFADPVHRAVGIAHSGWKGTLGKMGEVMTVRMADEFMTEPKDLIVCIGPGICMDCYEISDEVAVKFIDRFKDIRGFKGLNQDFAGEGEYISQKNAGNMKKYISDNADILREGRKGHYYLDLWKANKLILMNAGIPPENIYISGVCTKCNSRFLFSHRVMGEDRGNMAAFIGIR